MIDKLYLTNREIQYACHEIMQKIWQDNWRPDYIVGITRGGLIPALYLSHMTGTKMHTLDVRLRDGDGECETNCWMAEDAFGMFQMGGEYACKKILIVDDINDTGATFNWIKEDWQSSCLPSDHRWEEVWGNNVRFASVVDNLGSDFKVNYYQCEINKAEKDVWVVFPWEEPMRES